MICPKCRYEYREGIEVCPDCGERLTEYPPPRCGPLADEPPQFVEVYQAANWDHAESIRAELEKAGITCFVFPDRPRGTLAGALLPRIMMSRDVAEARGEEIQQRIASVHPGAEPMPRAPASKEPKLIEVHQASSPINADLIQMRLDQEGIPCFLFADDFLGIFGQAMRPRIMIPEDVASEQAQVIRACIAGVEGGA